MGAVKQWVDHDLKIYEPSSTPYYRITYVDADGERRQSSGGRTLRDAEKRVRELKREVDGEATSGPTSDMTVGKALKHYVNPDHHIGWGIRHAEEQERFVRLHIRPHLNLGKPAANLSTADFERILSERMKHTESLDTLKSAVQMCRTLVTHLQRNAGLQGDPMDGVGAKVKKRFRQQRTVPTRAATKDGGSIRVRGELDRIVPSWNMARSAATAYAERRHEGDVLTQEERELEILLHPYTGLRPGEGRALTAGQVNAEGSEIEVDRTLAEAEGKRWVKPPKNGQTRTVTVPPPIRARLAARRARAIAAEGPDALMFPAPRGGRWSRSNFARKFGPAKAAAGWLDDQSLRDLRHLYAVTALGDWGLPLEVVSAELGHHSPEFTSRRYLSRRQGYREAMEATFQNVDW